MATLIGCLAVFACGQVSEPVLPLRDFVITKSGAVGLLPPLVVCDFAPEKVAWSLDGQNLALTRHDPQVSIGSMTASLSGLVTGKGSVVTFDMKSRKPREVFSFNRAEGEVTKLGWLAGGSCFFVYRQNSSKPFDSLYFGNASTGRSNLVYTGKPDYRIDFHASPNRDFGILIVNKMPKPYDTFESSVGIVHGNLRFGPNLQLAEGCIVRENTWWSQDGGQFSLEIMTGPGQFKLERHSFDSVTGAITENFKSANVSAEFQGDYGVYEDTYKVQIAGETLERRCLILGSAFKSTKSSSVVAVDGQKPVMAPNGTAVFYVTGGIGIVRPLLNVPLETYQSYVARAEQTKLLADVHKCVQVFKEWVLDDDMVFPTPSSWAEKAASWIGSRPELKDFVYSFSGGRPPSEKVSRTVLGYKQGERGRAVAYLDGHVEWIAGR